MKVTVTKAGGHNARVGSQWSLSKADAREAARTGWATLTFKGAVCHVPVDCISPRPGKAPEA